MRVHNLNGYLAALGGGHNRDRRQPFRPVPSVRALHSAHLEPGLKRNLYSRALVYGVNKFYAWPTAGKLVNLSLANG